MQQALNVYPDYFQSIPFLPSPANLSKMTQIMVHSSFDNKDVYDPCYHELKTALLSVWYVSSTRLPFVALQFIDLNACLRGTALLFPTIPPTAHSSFPPPIPTTAQDEGYVG
jgi:hypothetical protein